ncbi:hypothetical protein, partial [Escherichia coli]|uniref:hypothetical protein n=1 Tax=Escherichia coli TaxID=562 RepID=UPI003F4539E9
EKLRISTTMRVEFATYNLTGAALLWWKHTDVEYKLAQEQLPEVDKSAMTWEQFCALIEENFINEVVRD